MMQQKPHTIKAIIGLGNPGPQFFYTRHNIGFRVADAIADALNAHFRATNNMELAETMHNGKPLLLIKPQTFMNSSGAALPYLTKKGIKADEILVIHDELELPFGEIKLKFGGSHKGHNGLKSIIGQIGADFWRLRFGIGRPENREDVPDYVLQKFKEKPDEIERLISQAQTILVELL